MHEIAKGNKEELKREESHKEKRRAKDERR
jgi:hypothetical protein